MSVPLPPQPACARSQGCPAKPAAAVPNQAPARTQIGMASAPLAGPRLRTRRFLGNLAGAWQQCRWRCPSGVADRRVKSPQGDWTRRPVALRALVRGPPQPGGWPAVGGRGRERRAPAQQRAAGAVPCRRARALAQSAGQATTAARAGRALWYAATPRAPRGTRL